MILAPTLTLSAGSGAAIVRPTFSRDFAGEKTLNNGTGPAITFTRGTNATFFDASGTLRLAPHNLLQRSEEFDNAYWNKANTTVTAGSATAPDAATSADTLTSSNGTAPMAINNQPQVAYSAGTYTFSLFVKTNGWQWVQLRSSATLSSAFANFDIVNGVVGTASGATAVIINAGSGWFRIAVTFAAAAANGDWALNLVTATNSGRNSSTTGDGTSGIFIWGAQLVTGSQAGEYFQTTDAAASMPRFDHDPASGNASRGLLIEEARTNSIRNSQAGGAVAGTPGTAPTNWPWIGSAGGLTRTITTGTASGFNYLDVRFNGTPTSTFQIILDAESSSQVVASSGQNWTMSVYIALVAGVAPDCTVGIREALSDGTLVTSGGTNFVSSLTSSLQRFSHTRALTDATTARVNGTIRVTATNGVALDFTLRIAAPQLEQGAFPTSYIPTTTAAVTRSADSAVVTPISSFYNQSEGTVVVEVSYANAGSDTNNANRVLAQFDDETSNNRHWIVNRGTNGAGGNAVATGGVTQATTSIGSTAVAAGVVVKLGAALKENDVIAAKDGTLSAQDTSATMPLVTRLGIGRSTTTAANLQGHIRKLAYWPKRLSNALLQQLTT